MSEERSRLGRMALVGLLFGAPLVAAQLNDEALGLIDCIRDCVGAIGDITEVRRLEPCYRGCTAAGGGDNSIGAGGTSNGSNGNGVGGIAGNGGEAPGVGTDNQDPNNAQGGVDEPPADDEEANETDDEEDSSRTEVADGSNDAQRTIAGWLALGSAALVAVL